MTAFVELGFRLFYLFFFFEKRDQIAQTVQKVLELEVSE